MVLRDHPGTNPAYRIGGELSGGGVIRVYQSIYLSIYLYIYIYIYVFVCVSTCIC